MCDSNRHGLVIRMADADTDALDARLLGFSSCSTV